MVILIKNSDLNLGNPNSAQTPLGERGGGRFQHLLVGLRDHDDDHDDHDDHDDDGDDGHLCDEKF